MELKNITTLLTVVTFTLASPVGKQLPRDEHPLDARQVASCETQTAAEQVSCIEACAGAAGCIVGCTATAVDGYINCAT